MYVSEWVLYTVDLYQGQTSSKRTPLLGNTNVVQVRDADQHRLSSHWSSLQLEQYMMEQCQMSMPPVEGADTIFEYMVNEEGKWQHWAERVSTTTPPTPPR